MMKMEYSGYGPTMSEYRGVTVSGLNGQKKYGAGASKTGTAQKKSIQQIQRAQQNRNVIKKRFNYNTQEISSQILRANKAQSASIVLVRAKSKLGAVKRCLGTGQYNDNEVRPAINHAARMVLVASKKVNNLREEERESRNYKKKKIQKKQERKREVQAAVEKKKEDILNEKLMEEMQEVQREKRQRMEMERKRRMHRNVERGKIAEADIKYLKELTDDKYDSEYRVDISGVVCTISASAAGLVGLENEAMFLSADGGELMLEGSLDAGSLNMGSMAADIASAGGSIDISL